VKRTISRPIASSVTPRAINIKHPHHVDLPGALPHLRALKRVFRSTSTTSKRRCSPVASGRDAQASCFDPSNSGWTPTVQ
jgi:hypothetical protein